MARSPITPFDISVNGVAEPAPIALTSNGGVLSCGRCVLRLSNPTGAAINAVIAGNFVINESNGTTNDLTVSVDAGSTRYALIADTTLYRQPDDGSIHVDGIGLNVVAFTVSD